MSKYRFKVVLLGETGVGKSSIVHRYQKGDIKLDSLPTIGMAFSTSKIHLDNVEIMLEIWDSAGQERFNSIVPLYFKNADAIICCYDIHDPPTQRILINKWITCVKEFFGDNMPLLVLVGTKLDLTKPSEDEYVKQCAKDMVRKTKYAIGLDQKEYISHYLTSSFTGENIQQVFQEIAYNVYGTQSITGPEDNNNEKIQLKPQYNRDPFLLCCNQ